jgi:hypothetical protein
MKVFSSKQQQIHENSQRNLQLFLTAILNEEFSSA